MDTVTLTLPYRLIDELMQYHEISSRQVLY